jgi:zinc carboxypeptidase
MLRALPLLTALIWFTAPVLAQQAMDDVYGAKIAEYTTDVRFSNPMVDHLPASDAIPSPLDHFGTIIGAPGILHYTAEIYGYLRALAEASPRVSVRTIGTTEENREQIEVIVADQTTMENLETYRTYLQQLSDPRSLSEEDAASIIAKAKPIYYITAGLHSPETGSPEMVMELAYRLAVSDDPMIRAIRENVILIFTPSAEPDGRDRVVDAYRYRADHDGVGPSLTYWGAYAAHDNNRDGFGLALDLTRNILGSFEHWKPQLMHDLHESVSYLYTSTGLGPYNEWIDPITVDEWHNLAYEEVSELTRRGMPGVWTHSFYNGWAANYLIWIANTRNSAGKFYETFGNSIPETVERKLSSRQTSREWYRPSPPLEKTMWSLRNNTNYMESGVLVALKYMADNATQFVENFWIKSNHALERGRTEAPYAWVIPRDQLRRSGTTNLVNLLMDQGLEVHTADGALAWNEDPDNEDEEAQTAEAGDFVIRADQPYNTLARVLLEPQTFPEGANAPYDDTGWTLPLAHNVDIRRVPDPAILDAPMTRLDGPASAPGGIEGRGRWLVVNHTTDDNFTVMRFELGSDVEVEAAEAGFEQGGDAFNAGSWIIRGPVDGLDALSERLGVPVRAFRDKPDVPTHPVEVPRVGLIHTWVSTPQDAGWWHFAFDEIGIPYTYLSEQDLGTEDLSQFDVLIMPRTRASSQTLVAGNSRVGPALPWQPSEEYAHIGRIDQTDDQRRGMGYDGLAALNGWINAGGLFIASGSTSAFPIDMGITRRISIKRTSKLQARGSIVRTAVADSTSPITYGFDGTVPAYFSAGPVFSVNSGLGDSRTPDWYKDAAWEAEVPRTVLSFAKKDLRMSGMLTGESELTGTPAVVDVPVGEGHVVLFAIRPVRRWNTQGNHALVFNAMMHWNDLRTGWPERPGPDGEEGGAGLLEWTNSH